MNILYAKAGKQPGAKFIKSINGKYFSYVGSKEEGVLIEELVFLALKEKDIVKEQFQALVETENEIYLITFNDFFEDNDGEDTILYSFSEFSQEEISSIINDLVDDLDNLVFVKYQKGELFFLNEFHNIDFKIKDSDIKAEVLFSKTTRAIKLLKSKFIEIILIVIIFLVPFLTIQKLNTKIIKENDFKINSLRTKLSKLKTERTEIEKKNFIKNKKYDLVKRRKDILDKKEFDWVWSKGNEWK